MLPPVRCSRFRERRAVSKQPNPDGTSYDFVVAREE
jgi:hypothetical protein